MNIRGKLLIALIEMTGAAWITYQQMPSDQQQHIRLLAYRNGARLLQNLARRIGEYGMRAEKKYAEEING